MPFLFGADVGVARHFDADIDTGLDLLCEFFSGVAERNLAGRFETLATTMASATTRNPDKAAPLTPSVPVLAGIDFPSGDLRIGGIKTAV